MRLGEDGFVVLLVTVGLLGVVLHVVGFEAFDIYVLLVTSLAVFTRITIDLTKRTLKTHEATVRLLMGVMGVLLFTLKLHLEGILLLTVFGVAEILEGFVERLAEGELNKILKLIPRTARIAVNGGYVEKDVGEVNKGDLVAVHEGGGNPG